MVIHFSNNDKDYTDWCKKHSDGFVFNCFGGKENRSDMNIVHRANCHFLWRKSDEGKRTTRYDKYCSENLDELIGFVEKERGASWKYCKAKLCFGTRK